MEQLVSPDRVTVITGDFNICLDRKPNNSITQFLSQMGFQQLVRSPTHVAGGRIDHTYLRDPKAQLESYNLTQYCPYYSDHDALCLTLTTQVETELVKLQTSVLINHFYRSLQTRVQTV